MKVVKILATLIFATLFIAGCARSVGPCYSKYCKAKPIKRHQPVYKKTY